MKLSKSKLNECIRWTSSKFNVYRKSEVIEKILNMQPGEEFEFSCGNYSENGNGYGYHYTAIMFEDKLYLRFENTNKIFTFTINSEN